jgi:hypothetical protein
MSDEIKSQLINLYVNIRSQILKYNNSTSNTSSSNEQFKKELEKLKESNIERILSYLKESIDFLISKNLNINCNSKSESNSNLTNLNEQTKETIEKESQSKYEKCLRKLEHDIRNHIKIEYELKLQNEFLQSKIDQLENILKVKKIFRDGEINFTDDSINYQYSPTTDRKENEILILRAENTNLKSTIEKLENSEKNLKELCEKYLIEIKNLKEEKEKIKGKKKICDCEEMTKKHEKLFEDFLLVSSQNEFYNKIVKIFLNLLIFSLAI